eukprot:scaffold1188_cov251-Pavlova_lutheri.AAC.2
MGEESRGDAHVPNGRGFGLGGVELAIARGPRSWASFRSGSGVGASGGPVHRHRAWGAKDEPFCDCDWVH